jgi:hypothetical protein
MLLGVGNIVANVTLGIKEIILILYFDEFVSIYRKPSRDILCHAAP